MQELPSNQNQFGPPLSEIPSYESAGAIPNPISVVEDFFQRPLDGEMIDAVRHLPADQFHLLASRCNEIGLKLNARISLRGIDERQQYSDDGYAAYESLKTGEIYMHANWMRAGLDGSIASTAGLKQALLYCDRLVLRNPLYGPLRQYDNQQEQKQHAFANQLRELLPLADLIRDGHIVMALDSHLFSQAYSAISVTIARSDPFINYLLAQHKAQGDEADQISKDQYNAAYWDILKSNSAQEPPPPGQYDAPIPPAEDIFGSEAHMQRIAAIPARIYPLEISDSELGRVMEFCARLRASMLTPVTADPLVRYHLVQGALAAAGRPLLPVPDVANFSPVVQFSAPSLSESSFDEVVQLRKQEQVFHEVRSALQALSAVCAAEAGQFEDYPAYQAATREYAEDIVRPVFERLASWERRTNLQKRAAKGLGAGAGLALDTVLPLVGRVAGETAGHLVSKRTEPKHDAARLGCQILSSLL